MAQGTTDKMEQKAKGAAHDAKTGISDSWVTVSLRGKVDSDSAKAQSPMDQPPPVHVLVVDDSAMIMPSISWNNYDPMCSSATSRCRRRTATGSSAGFAHTRRTGVA